MAKRQPYFKNWKNILSISFGLVYVLFLTWLLFHTSQYVPEGQEDYWFKVFLGYGILNSIIFGNADMRNKLFNVKFIRFLPRFFIFFVVSLLIYYFILKYFDPFEETLFGLLGNVPIWLAVIHALVFATTESVIWQGYLDQKIGHPWSEISAGLFHWGIWSGGAIIVIVSATVLFGIFSLVNWYFRDDLNDVAPAIGNHTAFNFVKLGILLSPT